MKKVIDGKVYNTETAELIADASYSYVSDFRYWEERLYKTKKGAWFLYGEGGAMSRWSVDCDGNDRGPGSGLRVLTEAEALSWCEGNDVDADTIAEHFEVEAA